jgi:arylsulfatase A-like enzyme
MNAKCYQGVRRGLVLLGLCLTLSASADLASLFTNLNTTKPVVRPRLSSILIIQCDSLGYLDLSCYGQTNFATPNLDRLASAGMMFTNYDASGADRRAAQASLLLGCDPAQPPAVLPADEPTLAQVLKASGYHTGLIGQWNFGGPGSGNAPWEKGFDEFAGYFTDAEAENYYADFMWRYSPNSILNTNTHQFETYIGREALMGNAGGAKGAYIPDLYTRAAIKYIRNHTPTPANHYQPFFLWLSYPTPRPNLAEARSTGNGVQVPTDAPYSEAAWPAPERNKAAMITRLDTDIGTILDYLARNRLTNNVAVFFSSATVPQKEAGLDPTFFPSVVSTNDVRLPMIAWWPRHIPAGQVSGYHWTPADFLPTAARIAFTDAPTNATGTCILPVLYGRPLASVSTPH